MAVYVDFLIDYGWYLGPSCHLMADDVDELNEFASKIGMKISWLQKGLTPHYDLVKGKRKQAIKLGAIEIKTREELHEIITKINKL